MQKKIKTLLLASLLATAGAAQAGEIGVGLPGTALYYHDTTAGKTEYRIGATLGTPTTLFADYRGQIKQVDHLFWEAGLSVGSAGGFGIPLSLGYRLQIEKRFAIEPLLSIDAMSSTTSFGINIAYKL